MLPHFELDTGRSLRLLGEASLDVAQIVVVVAVEELFAPYVEPLALLHLPLVRTQSTHKPAVSAVYLQTVECLLLQSSCQMIQNFHLI